MKMPGNKTSNKFPLWNNIFKKSDEGELDILKIIKNIPIFMTMSLREIRTLQFIIYERKYKPGEYLFREGNPAAGMFIIKKGTVVIERQWNNKEIVDLAKLGNGDFFGELALLSDAPRSASARAETPTDVIVLFREDLFEIFEKKHSIGVKILKELAKMIGDRLVETNNLLLQQSFLLKEENDGKRRRRR